MLRSRALAILVVALLAVPAFAQTGTAPTATAPTPEQVKSLVQLLSDPVVKSWLERQLQSGVVDEAATPSAAVPAVGISGLFEQRLNVWRTHLHILGQALPGLPGEVTTVIERIGAELTRRGLVDSLLLIVGFVAVGYGCELLYWRYSAPFRARIAVAPLDTPAGRIRAMLARFLFGLAWVGSFAIGSIGAFLLFSWPDSLRALVLGYLMAILILRVALVLARFLYAPDAARFRVLPMDDAQAARWYRASVAFVGWYAFGYITIELLRRFGMSEGAAEILAYVLGLALLAIALRLIWRPGATTTGRTAGMLAAVTIYVAWIIGARLALWALIVGAAMVVTLRVTRRAVHHLFRQEADLDPAAAAVPNSPWSVVVDRGTRALLIVAGIATLAWGWDLDLFEFARQDTPTMRFVRGAIDAGIILLVADLLWQLARTAIDRQLANSAGGTHEEDGHATPDLSPEELRRRGRIRTLLPILRIVTMVVLAVMAVLMALSALGVQVAPLIAGAGVVGVAIGFGSQTLVRDIISGMFYLLDDAFRVGEYIVSGSYRGTVEGFSLRSIKLRHHRGPLFTVPFGVLGAVQNLSRDWVIDKISFNVPFDTDIGQVKKVVKQVSQEIMADPTLAKGIIEPLKSQGVATIGDFAMQVRMKFKARPGEQFVVRRAAFDKIKRAFAANGIKIAVPTVTVAGGDAQGSPAVAQQAISMRQSAEAE